MSENSRRDFLTKGATIGAGALGVAAFLEACTTSTSSGSTGSSSSGTSRLQDVLSRGTVKVGIILTLPPFGFQDTAGNPTGLEIDIAHQIANNLFKDPKKVTFVEQTMDARLPNLIAGKVDFTIEALTLTAPRAQVAEFTFPYFRDGSTTLALANSPYSGAKDMTGHHLRVSAYDNGFADQIIHAGIPDAVLVGFSSDALALQAMEAGDVPVFSASVANAGYLVSQHPGKYKLGNVTWFPQSYGIAVAPGDSRWLNFLNVNIKEMATGVDNDFFRGLYKKYLGTDLPVVPSGFPVEYGVLH